MSYQGKVFTKQEAEQVLAAAVMFLMQGEQSLEAGLLLSCSGITINLDQYRNWHVILRGPRAVYEYINNDNYSGENPIEKAIRASLPRNEEGEHSDFRLQAEQEKAELSENWRRALREQLSEPVPINQAVNVSELFWWKGHRFRSPAEVAIAKAFDEVDVLVFPNCFARLNISPGVHPVQRGNKESDFLVCKNGKWGILEVDGRAFHQSAADDYKKDRLFRAYGVKVVDRYSATDCLKNPAHIVKQFLELLEKNA